MSVRQRLTLVAAILGSGVAMIDGTIVNVALPAIQRDLGGGLPAQQWVSNAYLLVLGSLILIGGSLSDIYGERLVFVIGVAAFGVFSVACAVAPTIGVLIAARALQGAAGALLTPSSLAIIVTAFPPRERAAAIGAWTAWGGIGAIVGPLAGGLIVDHVSWRWVFALNVPLVAATIALVLGGCPAGGEEGLAPNRFRGCGAVRARPRRLRLRADRATALRLDERRDPGAAGGRRAPVRGVPALGAPHARADAEARAVLAPQLRGRESRDAGDVRGAGDPVLLPRHLPPAGGRLQRAAERAGRRCR